MAECSELGLAISDIALNLGSRPEVKNIDDIVRQMNKSGLKVDRPQVVEALVLANKPSRTLSDLAKKLNKIKEEARTDVRLREQIDKLQTHLKEGTRPTTATRADLAPQAIKALRATRGVLKRKLTSLDSKAREVERLEKRIGFLESHVKAGTLPPAQKGKPRPVSDEVKKLRERRDKLQKTITTRRLTEKQTKQVKEKIAELEKHLREGTLPTVQKKTTKVSPELKRLRERRDALRKELGQSEPAMRKRLQESIDLLNQKLATGVELPKKRPEIKLSDDLEHLKFERDQLRREVNQRIRDLKPKSVFQQIAEPFNFARSIMASVDVSAVLRQGGFVALGNPKRALKNFPDMFKAMASPQKASQVNKEIFARPNAPLYLRSKLHLSPIDDVTASLSKREEVYMSNLLDKVDRTKIGKFVLLPVKASERAYITFLNKLRADSFDAMAKTLAKHGEPTQEELNTIANFVNVATGRGNLGQLDQAATSLNTAFFAPKYVASRFQLLSGEPFFRADARTRKLIAKEYAKYLIGLGTIYSLGSLAGFEIEKDPRSSDFGKMKMGNTRLDPLSGLSQTTVLLSRLATGETKSSITGKVKDIRGEGVPFGGKTTFDVITDFGRTKLSPMFGTAIDVATGKNVIGQPVTAQSTIENLTIPLSLKDVKDVMEEQGVSKGVAFSLAAMLGMGLQTYGAKEFKPKTRKKKSPFGLK